MHIPDQALLNKISFGYFDGVVVVWLIIGLLRGRKQGMSQELLPMLKWICIVVLAGLFYRPFSSAIRQNTGSSFGPLGANITAYLLIMLALLIGFTWIKKLIGEKLVGSDMFGTSEYYLGMLGGMVRFACMMLALLAVMNSRIYSKAENDAYVAAQKKQIDNSFFPSYGEIQYQMLTTSFTGRQVRQHLSSILIASVTPDQMKSGETPGQKGTEVIDQVLGPPKK